MHVSALLAWFAIFTGVCAMQMVTAQNNSWSSPASTNEPIASLGPNTSMWASTKASVILSAVQSTTKLSETSPTAYHAGDNDLPGYNTTNRIRSNQNVNSQCATSSSPANLTGSGQLSSPNYPSNYVINAYCNWIITATYPQVVMLTFIAFSTESCCDKVSLYDGYSTSAQLIVQLSGTHYTLPNYFSTQIYMLVTFTTDYSLTLPGFLASYQQQLVSYQCASSFFPSTLTGSGQFASQNYPQNYPINADCNWRITAPVSQVVMLTVLAFSTDSSYDYLSLYDGYDASTWRIVRLSGYLSAQQTYYSTQSYMFVNFRTDSFGTASGFVATYQPSSSATVTTTTMQPVNSQCASSYFPTTLTGSGQISSQNYPQNYLNNADCNWRIMATRSHVVTLTFSTFVTESGGDSVSLYDGYDTSAGLIAQLSGSLSTLSSYYSTQSYMLINFRTNSIFTASGFMATYQTSNGIVVTTTKLIWIMFFMIGVMNSFAMNGIHKIR